MGPILTELIQEIVNCHQQIEAMKRQIEGLTEELQRKPARRRKLNDKKADTP
jgi:hypothetical protein